jgi:hypothetical protein
MRRSQALQTRLRGPDILHMVNTPYLPLSKAIMRYSFNGCMDPQDEVFHLLWFSNWEDHIYFNYTLSVRDFFRSPA